MAKESASKGSRHKLAVVTGSGTGIGQEIALALARTGFDIALIARRHAPLAITARRIKDLGREAIAVPADVTSERALTLAHDSILEKFKRVDVLVNNAAVQGPTMPVNEISPKEWRSTIDIDLTGAFLCTKAFLPSLLRSKHASIVNISSVAALRGVALRTPYCAAKHGLIGFTKALAQELGPKSVRVNVICPGPVLSAAVEEVVEERSKRTGVPYRDLLHKTLRSQALGRPITTDEVAAAVVFFASDASTGITGQMLTVAGGD